MAEVSLVSFESTFLEFFITDKLFEHVNTDIVQSGKREIIAFLGREGYIQNHFPTPLSVTLCNLL